MSDNVEYGFEWFEVVQTTTTRTRTRTTMATSKKTTKKLSLHLQMIVIDRLWMERKAKTLCAS